MECGRDVDISRWWANVHFCAHFLTHVKDWILDIQSKLSCSSPVLPPNLLGLIGNKSSVALFSPEILFQWLTLKQRQITAGEDNDNNAECR